MDYLKETNERFSKHHEGIAVSHESIIAFIDTVQQNGKTMESETPSEKSDEQNMSNNDDDGGFIPVNNRWKKRNNNRKRNKKNKKKGSLGSTVINNNFGMGGGKTFLESSTCSTGEEEDCNATLNSSDTEPKK